MLVGLTRDTYTTNMLGRLAVNIHSGVKRLVNKKLKLLIYTGAGRTNTDKILILRANTLGQTCEVLGRPFNI